MANVVYVTGVQHPWRAVRVGCMGALYHACIMRSLLLFWRELLALLALVEILRRSCGVHPLTSVGLVMLATQVWCWVQASQRVEFVAGHRAGAKGYTGVYVENTVEAMRALVQEDNGPRGPVADLHYVEVDVQETADGELIVLHDFHLGDAFPNGGPNAQPYTRLRTQLGLPQARVGALHVKDVTLAQLQSLHLGARTGLRAPTLQAFMAAFRAADCRRPLVLEIKRLQTDAARERLLALLQEHQPYAAEQQRLYPQHAAPRLGFLALISFPHFYARAFGEYQSSTWRQWASRLAALGIPVRCCFLDSLSYTRGITAH